MTFNKTNQIVYLSSVFAILLWGMSYIWSDSVIERGIPVEFLVFLRILVAGVLLLILNVITGQNIKIKRKDLPSFLLLSLFEPFIYFVAESYGIKLTESATYSSLIVSTIPIFSVVAGVVVFKEKINLMNALGILICMAGLIMVTLNATTVGEYFIFGLILLLVAVLSEVAHASFTKLLTGSYSPQVIVMHQFLIGSVYLLPLFLTRGIKDFDTSLYLSWEVLTPILCLAVFCSSIAFSLWANAIKHLGVAKSSIFLAMIPIVTAFVGHVLGQESLTYIQIAGIAISCLGLIFSQLVFKKRKPAEVSSES